jgi:hypothetical protein
MLVDMRIRLPHLRVNRSQLRSQRFGTIRKPRLHQRKVFVEVDVNGNNWHRLADRWLFVGLKEVELHYQPPKRINTINMDQHRSQHRLSGEQSGSTPSTPFYFVRIGGKRG